MKLTASRVELIESARTDTWETWGHALRPKPWCGPVRIGERDKEIA